MRILCTGLSHKTAEVAVREKLAFDPVQMRRALADLAARWRGAEFALLSTCNRVELYAVRPVHGHPRAEELRDWLAGFHGLEAGEFAAGLYTLADAEAARHLFAVAAGLDSLVPGEPQIVAQMKDAYAAAVESAAAGAVLNDLFQAAFHVAKHIRTETDIGAGRVSVASVAVDCVRQVFGDLSDKCVLSVGAGKMTDLMLKHLADLKPRRLLVANRSPDRAASLAVARGGQTVPFENLPRRLADADVVLTSTAAETPILSERMIRDAQVARGARPLLLIDIAVPRDVEPAAGKVENVFLYNIDDLDRVVLRTFSTRDSQRDAAEGIIDEHVSALMEGLNVRDVAPTIDALYRLMERIAAEELADARNKLAGHPDAGEDEEILRRALHRTIRRILHPAAANLRNAAGCDSVRARLAAIRELFDLDGKE